MGRTAQERAELWEKLQKLVEKHNLGGILDDAIALHGMDHALHVAKEHLLSCGEDVSVVEAVREEFKAHVEESCSEGCRCASHQELSGAVGSNEVTTPTQE